LTLSNPRALADFSDLLPVGSVKFRPQLYQQVDGQASGDFLVQDLASPLWIADIQIDALTSRADARRLGAVINSLPPPLTFYLVDPVAEYPAADPDGSLLAGATVLIHSIGDDNSSMSFSGLPAYFQLNVGDRFDLDFGADPLRHAYLELAEAAAASAAGQTVELAVRSAIWPGILPTAQVNFIRPAAKMMFVPGQDLTITYTGTKATGPAFQAIERL
jgi:hypothetical protein